MTRIKFLHSFDTIIIKALLMFMFQEILIKKKNYNLQKKGENTHQKFYYILSL